MQELIKSYEKSCEMAKIRISELTELRRSLEKQGLDDQIGELDLDRRIKLLYTECEQMQEIIEHLSSWRRGDIVKT